MMPKYFFHLAGIIPAHDVVGHECKDDEEARDHGSFIAHRIGTEKPEMVQEENSISVVNEAHEEIANIPLTGLDHGLAEDLENLRTEALIARKQEPRSISQALW